MTEDTASNRVFLDDQLCFALYTATNAVTRAYRPLLGAIGLTYPQYLVMLALWQDGTSTIGDIARRLQLGASALTPLIDGLEAAGFLTRTRATNDRRVVRVDLTPTGLALEDSAKQAQSVVNCRIGLTPVDMKKLQTELSELIQRMAAEPAPAETS